MRIYTAILYLFYSTRQITIGECLEGDSVVFFIKGGGGLHHKNFGFFHVFFYQFKLLLYTSTSQFQSFRAIGCSISKL